MITFAEQAEIYLAGLKARKRSPVKPTTLSTFESLIRHHAIPFLGDRTLSEIDNAWMRDFVSHLVEEELSARSIKLAVMVTKQVITSAVDNRGNRLYPVVWNSNFIDAPSPNDNAEPPAATAQQIENALSNARPVIYELLATLCATGLRKGEALALRVADFDASAGVLHVRGTRSRFGRTSPKTKSSTRDIDLTPEIVEMLKRMLAGRNTAYLFPITIDELRWAFHTLGIKAHACRRYRASWLRFRRCHDDVIRYWLGHGSESQTDAYVRLNAVWQLQTLVHEVGLGFALPQRIAAPEPQQEVVFA